jgi:hypothetical protein
MDHAHATVNIIMTDRCRTRLVGRSTFHELTLSVRVGDIALMLRHANCAEISTYLGCEEGKEATHGWMIALVGGKTRMIHSSMIQAL